MAPPTGAPASQITDVRRPGSAGGRLPPLQAQTAADMTLEPARPLPDPSPATAASPMSSQPFIQPPVSSTLGAAIRNMVDPPLPPETAVLGEAAVRLVQRLQATRDAR